jgi:pimeloyl-ACP methyl ester carboxylesterase
MPQATRFEHSGTTGAAALAAEPLTDAAGPVRLVWLHGWGQSRESLRPLALSLAHLGEAWLLDLPGHGAAPMPPTAWAPKDYAELLLAWLNTMPPMPTVLLGHSFGFRVAVWAAYVQPQRVTGLVALGGAGLPRKLTLVQHLKRWAVRRMMGLGRLLQPVLGPGLLTHLRLRFGSRDYLAAGALRPTFVRVVNDNLQALCAHVKQPTLLLYGAEDTETPPDVGRSFARRLPNATLQVLSGHTHHSLYGSGRHVVAQLLQRHWPQLIQPKA